MGGVGQNLQLQSDGSEILCAKMSVPDIWVPHDLLVNACIQVSM